MVKVALIWVKYGPYHEARAKALAKRVDLHLIELAAEQRLYGWGGTMDGELRLDTLAACAFEDLSQLELSRRLWRRMNMIRPDVLMIPGYSPVSAVVAALWGRFHGKRNILMTETTESDHARHPWRERAKSVGIRWLFDRAIVGGRRAAVYLARLGFPGSATGYFYDVVDNAFFLEGAAAVGQGGNGWGPAKEDFFLYVGRLAPEKNLHRLIGAYERYREGGGTWGLTMVGGGRLADELGGAARKTRYGGEVYFAGHRGYNELLPYYAQTQALILPSISEPWGLVVNEAMASGLPVIVSRRCGCVDDVVEHGRNGFVFDPMEEEELAGCMLRMERMSREERRAMGKRSEEIIERYSPEAWAVEAERLIRG